MDVEVVCPRPYWDRLLQEGLRPEAEALAYEAPVGVSTERGRLRLSVRAPFRPGAGASAGAFLRVRFRSGRPSGEALPVPAGWWGELILGRGPAEGRWAGRVRTPEGETRPITSVFLPGPGMFRLSLRAEPNLADLPELRVRWSRTRGALGEDVWGRLVRLRMGIVGCGRLGSTVATALARNGVQTLVLVDPDRVEPHNLGEGEGWTEADTGAFKAEALARRIEAACPWTRVEAVAASVETWAALHALKGCDLLVCAADTERARETAGLLAARYHLPLVEAGTGVFADPGGGRRMGLEVRLILPWEACRPCLEGRAASSEGTDTPWWADRMGSLRSLNMAAAGLVLMLLEALVGEEVTGSVEIRQMWGEPLLQTPPGRSCGGPGCLRPVVGMGDEVLTAAGATEAVGKPRAGR